MTSNIAFASRNIFARASMDRPKGTNMTPVNLFGVLTLLSFAFTLPVALAASHSAPPSKTVHFPHDLSALL